MAETTPNPEPTGTASSEPPSADAGAGGASDDTARKRRRRGSRGGRNRSRGSGAQARTGDDDRRPDELPERVRENKPSPEAADRALVRRTEAEGGARPRIGDSRPAPAAEDGNGNGDGQQQRRKRRRGGRGRGRSVGGNRPVEAVLADGGVEVDPEVLERRRGKERKGRPVGRYLMAVHVGGGATQIAVLEGRSLIEHYVARPADDVSQIHGNVYLGKVQNVLPGMEAAFVDIGTPKNAVLYRGDVQFDPEDVESSGPVKIEHILKAKQSIVCQVTKNPIGAKGARLTQEVSLPGRFVVLIPNSSTYGISKRLADDERKRLRSILDKIKPSEHGLIVRTAAEGATREELERDVARLLGQWRDIEGLAKRSQAPALLYREPDMAVRVIREEFNSSYRGVVIDDRKLFEDVRDYVASISPELADRVEFHDPAVEPLPLFEQHHVHEQVHKALDRKVWLPSGGSLIIERTEALTVIDVNTGKNVGRSSLEETVFQNNLEAAEEVARQLRLRDIGGIIVIDFIDMEIRKNRDEVVRVFREALARDKTRTQVFEISELGLVEMTRKRIGEGLLESMALTCPECEGRGVIVEKALLEG
jgi:ribonuclease E